MVQSTDIQSHPCDKCVVSNVVILSSFMPVSITVKEATWQSTEHW